MDSRVRALCAAAVITVGVAALTLTPSASARSSQWAADWVSNTGNEVLETGQIVAAQVKAKNVGSAVWHQGTVNLGTQEPQDSASPYAINEGPDAWINPSRAATIAEQSIASGGIGTFNFKIRAPSVASEQVVRQYFAPVAEGIDWMYGCPPNGNWCGVHIYYTIRPQQNPSARFVSGPANVQKGKPVEVEAEATDNVGIARVVFSLEGAEVVDTSAPYTASFASDGLSAGGHVVTVKAFDRVGLSASDFHSFSVADGSAGGGEGPGGGGEGPGGGGEGPGTETGVLEQMDADAKLEYQRTLKGKVLNGIIPKSFKVTAPKGSRIELSCSKKRCKRSAIASTVRGTTDLSSRLPKKRLPVKTRIEIRVTKAGTRGLLIVYTVLKGDHKKRSTPILPARASSTVR